MKKDAREYRIALCLKEGSLIPKMRPTSISSCNQYVLCMNTCYLKKSHAKHCSRKIPLGEKDEEHAPLERLEWMWCPPER